LPVGTLPGAHQCHPVAKSRRRHHYYHHYPSSSKAAEKEEDGASPDVTSALV